MSLLVGQSVAAVATVGSAGPAYVTNSYADASVGEVVGYDLYVAYYYRSRLPVGRTLRTHVYTPVMSVVQAGFRPVTKQLLNTIRRGPYVDIAPAASGGSFGCRANFGFVRNNLYYYVEDWNATVPPLYLYNWVPTPFRDSVSNASLGAYGPEFVKSNSTARSFNAQAYPVGPEVLGSPDWDATGTVLDFLFRWWLVYSSNTGRRPWDFFDAVLAGRGVNQNLRRTFTMLYTVDDTPIWTDSFYGGTSGPTQPVDPDTPVDPPGPDDVGETGSGGVPVTISSDYQEDDAAWPDVGGDEARSKVKLLNPVLPKVVLR